MSSRSDLAPERTGAFYIPSLDGIRAVAFLIVFFSHAGPLARVVPGGFGVTIFFFLSGYLITTLLRLEDERTARISLSQFYLRRALRIFPPMYVALAAAVVLSRIVAEPMSGRVVALQMLQFTNYHVALHGVGHAVGTTVLWSLSVEEHFYLLFPLAYLTLRKWFPRPQTRAAILLGASGVVLAWRTFVVVRLQMDAEYTAHATDTRIDSLLLGCALAHWKNPAIAGKQLSPAVVCTSSMIALPVLVWTLVARDPIFRETARYSIQGLALAPLFIAAVRFPAALPFRLLNLSVVRRLGVLSYSLYLVHLPLIETLRRIGNWSESVVAALAFALSLIGAETLYRLVEQPCAIFRKRLSRLNANFQKPPAFDG